MCNEKGLQQMTRQPFFDFSCKEVGLVPSPCVPSGRKRSGERKSKIFLAFSQKVLKTKKISKPVVIT